MDKISDIVLDLTGEGSKSDLARALRIEPAAVYGWDKKGILPPYQALKMCKIYKIPVEKFFFMCGV